MKTYITIGFIAIVVVLYFSSSFIDFDTLFHNSSQNDDKENEVRHYTKEEIEKNDSEQHDKKEKDDESEDKDEEDMQQSSQKTAEEFVKHFYNQDDSKGPVAHIEASEPYMDDEFYDFLIGDYPKNIDGDKKQQWKDVSAEEFGKTGDNRIWDVHIKGKSTEDGSTKKEELYYVVKVTEENGETNVTNFWVDPSVARDKSGKIDVYEGKKDMGEDDDSKEIDETEVLIDMLNAEQGETE